MTVRWRARYRGWPLLGALALVPGAVQAQLLFSDDMESGRRLKSDSPPGPWDVYQPVVANVSMTPQAAAARTGAWGLRLTDTEATDASGAVLRLTAVLSAPAPAVYLRTWLRVASSNMANGIDLIQVRNARTDGSTINISLSLNEMSVGVGGYDSTGNLFQRTPFFPEVGRWYLVELQATGAGTATGTHRFWVDGVLIHERTVSWPDPAWQVTHLIVGEPFSASRLFMGEVDFDNLRMSANPPASHLTWTAPATAETEVCTPVELTLRDSLANNPAAALSTLTVDLNSVGGARFFLSADCANEVSTATLNAGASSLTVYVEASAAGVVALNASHGDFLPATQTFTVVAPAVSPVLEPLPEDRVLDAPERSLSVQCGYGTGQDLASTLVGLWSLSAWLKCRRQLKMRSERSSPSAQ